MSCRVLVIPEDPTHNGAILGPLISRMLDECGRPRAKVTVLTNPRLRGIEDVRESMAGIADRYAHFDLRVCVVDQEGLDRTGLFQSLAGRARVAGRKLVCCAAVQEVEAWLLAGHSEKLGAPWATVRADASVKENFFAPFLAQYGDRRRPGGGRQLLMEQTLANYSAILGRCPELTELENRIREVLSAGGNP